MSGRNLGKGSVGRTRPQTIDHLLRDPGDLGVGEIRGGGLEPGETVLITSTRSSAISHTHEFELTAHK